jgi:hypothetical protein
LMKLMHHRHGKICWRNTNKIIWISDRFLFYILNHLPNLQQFGSRIVHMTQSKTKQCPQGAFFYLDCFGWKVRKFIIEKWGKICVFGLFMVHCLSNT